MTTSKRLAIHGAVALAALMLAYYAWRRDQRTGEESGEEDGASVVVAQISRESLKGIRFDGGDRRVNIVLAREEGRPHWVEVTTKRKVVPQRPRREPPRAKGGADAGPQDGGGGAAATADGGATGGDGGPVGDAGGSAAERDGGLAEPEPRWEETTVRFAGSKAVDELIAKATPLRSFRALGKLTREQREEFELGDGAHTLEILTDGPPRRFLIGARTVGAGSRFYVLDESTGEGHLISSTIVRDLQMANSRLMQRELHRFEPDAVAKAVIVAGERRRELEHRDRDVPQKATWVVPGGSEAASKTSANWMRQLQRLRALAYPSSEDDFSGDRANRVFRIGLFDEGGEEIGFVVLAKHPTKLEYFGRSEATDSWVRVSRAIADQLASDVDEILAEE